jgi:hypothetical protein
MIQDIRQKLAQNIFEFSQHAVDQCLIRNIQVQEIREAIRGGYGDRAMMNTQWNETFIEQEVTYVIVIDGVPCIIEHVPARVNAETGEQLFSPETVERLQQIIHSQPSPDRVIATPVFEFAV